jgi:cytochrome c-type biogenesis protein CcmH/NrfG
MKKLTRLFLATLIVFCSLNFPSMAASKAEKAPHETLTPQQQVRLQVITERLTEIKHMDKSTLTKSEKKSLKSELKQLKKEARGMAVGGVFLTVASLLAVIVLLILLL